MKNIFKKLSCVLLAAVMICTITPFTASAATSKLSYPKTKTIYLAGKNVLSSYGGIEVSNIPSKQSISKSNIKIISGKNVVALDSLDNSTQSDRIEYFGKGNKPDIYFDHYYNIGLRIKKTGTAKISFKVGSKTYTSTIKAVAYTNPLKSLTITGTSGNLAGKFKTSNNGYLQNKKTRKNTFIKCTAASGWKITSVYFSNQNTGVQRNIFYTKKNASSFNFYTGDLAANQKAHLNILLVNTKTGGTQICTFHIN